MTTENNNRDGVTPISLSLEEQVEFLYGTNMPPTDENGNVNSAWQEAWDVYNNTTRPIEIEIEPESGEQNETVPITSDNAFQEMQDSDSTIRISTGNGVLSPAGNTQSSVEYSYNSFTPEMLDEVLSTMSPSFPESTIRIENADESTAQQLLDNLEPLNPITVEEPSKCWNSFTIYATNTDICEIHLKAHYQLAEILPIIETELQGHYGENFDIQVNDLDVKIYLYYPECTITNADGLRTDIKELYIKLDFVYENDILKLRHDVSGTRSRVTYKEYIKHYVHSHLPSRTMKGFGEFCLGNDELNIMNMELKTIGLSISNIDKFGLLLYMLDELSVWESIEGAPYVYIKSLSEPINQNQTEDISTRDLETALLKFYDELKNNILDLDWLNYDEYSSTFHIQFTDELENLFVKCTDKYMAKSENDNFYNPIETPIAVEEFIDTNFQSFIFKDREVVKIIEGYTNNTEWPENLRKYANRNITVYIQQNVQLYLNKLLTILAYETEKQRCKTSISYKRRLILKDFTPVYGSIE